jgi:hypothetical protein
MKITYVVAGLLLATLLPSASMAQPRAHKSAVEAQASMSSGRQIIAPPWSAACLKDTGPTACGERTWFYGSNEALQQYLNAY